MDRRRISACWHSRPGSRRIRLSVAIFTSAVEVTRVPGRVPRRIRPSNFVQERPGSQLLTAAIRFLIHSYIENFSAKALRGLTVGAPSMLSRPEPITVRN
jgi:hypothetical protein